MELFGIKVERVHREKPGNGLNVGAHEDLNTHYVPLGVGRNVDRTDFWKRITFPDPSNLGVFEKLKYTKLLVEFAERLNKPTSFDICFLRDLMKLCDLKYTEQTDKFMTELSYLHCLDFKHIPPEILEVMPMMMTAIFTEGRSLRDINETGPEPVLLTQLEHRTKDKRWPW